MGKKCSICKEEKSLTEFHKRGNKLRSECKTCKSKIAKEDYHKNHEFNKERNRKAWHKLELKKALKNYEEMQSV